jgi:hypothetical protein
MFLMLRLLTGAHKPHLGVCFACHCGQSRVKTVPILFLPRFLLFLAGEPAFDAIGRTPPAYVYMRERCLTPG